MKAISVMAMGLLIAGVSIGAHAGEARLSAGLAVGGATLEDDAGDELTADLESLTFSGTYFLDQAGPFFGIGIGQEEADDFEFNGDDLGIGSIEADSRVLTAGYRTGKRGEPQLIFAISLEDIEVDGGSDSDSTIVSFGVERDFQSYRFSVIGRYQNGDGDSSVGADLQATFFASEELGLFVAGGYSAGEADFDGEDVDSRDFHIGGGVELRFFPE